MSFTLMLSSITPTAWTILIISCRRRKHRLRSIWFKSSSSIRGHASILWECQTQARRNFRPCRSVLNEIGNAVGNSTFSPVFAAVSMNALSKSSCWCTQIMEA